MAQHLWLIYALSASILWGIGYAASEKVLKYSDGGISPAFLIITIELITLPIYFIVCIYFNQLREGISTLFSSPFIFWLVFVKALCIVGGNLLIYYSIIEKNATLATMIEISYPFFVAVFAFLFFKDMQLTWWTAVGGLLIFSGIAVILLKS